MASFIRALDSAPRGHTVKPPFAALREDGLTRTFDVCKATCQDPDPLDEVTDDAVDCKTLCARLGQLTLSIAADGSPSHNAHEDDDCSTSGLSLNLFDSAIGPHAQVCHRAREAVSPYMDLVLRTVTNFIHQQRPATVPFQGRSDARRAFTWSLSYGSVFDESHLLAAAADSSSPPVLETTRGGDGAALTGVQVGALQLLDIFIKSLVRDGIKGDVAEAGVWRGGASIVMAASLTEAKGKGKRVWLFDSFRGVPESQSHRDVVDEVDSWVPNRYACSKAEVKETFRRFGLHRKAIFVEGPFNETLRPEKRTKKNKLFPRRLSLLRVDVDSYEGTLLVLEALWDKLSPGGFVVVDDYHLEGCRAAVHEFRARKGSVHEHGSLMFVPIDYVNTCDFDSVGQRLDGLRESMTLAMAAAAAPIVDLTFRSGPQVVWWRKM